MTAQRPPTAPPPFPDVRSAFLLTIGAILAGGLVGVLFFDLGPLAADGIGTALGIGGVATLAARRVAEPQALRIGLVPLPLRAWPMILCLVPAVLIASELDNFAYDWSPKPEVAGEAEPGAEAEADAEAQAAPAELANTAPNDESSPDADAAAAAAADSGPGSLSGSDALEGGREDVPEAEAGGAEDGTSETRPTAIAEAIAKAAAAAEAETPKPLIDPSDPFSLMEAFIVVVGIGPVIHEFLFRGVLQQGLVAQLGLMRGVTLASLLWTMLRPPGLASPARFAAAFVAWFALGWLLGMVRQATGSILGSILLASLWAAVGFASLALQDRVALPGMNVDGTHLPPALTIASVLLVAWAGRKVLDEARARAPGRSSPTGAAR